MRSMGSWRWLRMGHSVSGVERLWARNSACVGWIEWGECILQLGMVIAGERGRLSVKILEDVDRHRVSVIYKWFKVI